MAGNVEIFDINSTEIPKCEDEIAQYRTVNFDAEIIVKEILFNILETAVNKSEESHQKILGKEENLTICHTETGDLIDLTRNYKQEFRTLLRNLKCNSQRTQLFNNATLEDQIKKVIDEIKSLETTVRLNIRQEGRGDIDLMSTESFNTNQMENKSDVTEFLNGTSEDKTPHLFIGDDLNDEIVLQVIDLQPEDSDMSSLTNVFASDDDLEEVTLTSQQSVDEGILDQGDQVQTADVNTESSLTSAEQSAGETAVINPVPNPEPNASLGRPNDGKIRKKKSLGKRFWNFFKKNSTSSKSQSSVERNSYESNIQ